MTYIEDRIKALEDEMRKLVERVEKLEKFAGTDEFDVYRGISSLHRRIDYLEDWRRDRVD